MKDASVVAILSGSAVAIAIAALAVIFGAVWLAHLLWDDPQLALVLAALAVLMLLARRFA